MYALAPHDEPPMGAVLLVHGSTGTVYQRHHSDGLYHSTSPGGRVVTLDELRSAAAARQQPIVVLYDPNLDAAQAERHMANERAAALRCD